MTYKFWLDPKFYTLLIESVASIVSVVLGIYVNDPNITKLIITIWGSLSSILTLIFVQQGKAQGYALPKSDLPYFVSKK